MAAPTVTDVPIGPRIRALREHMDLSLRDLAERSGVSAPMLSQVERGETSPTLQVAARIAAGLELRLSQLLRLDESGAVSITRARERRQGGTAGHSYEVLTPPEPGQRAELLASRPRTGRRHRRARRPARSTSPAPARSPSCTRATSSSTSTASATRWPRATA